MAKRKMSSAGRSWMVALMLLCNLSKVKPAAQKQKEKSAASQKSDIAFNRRNEFWTLHDREREGKIESCLVFTC